MKPVKLLRWGPKKLREIVVAIEGALNARTPHEGLGISLDESSGKGFQISTKLAGGAAIQDSKDGLALGGSGGTNVNVYGALNGAPAVYHLLQSSPPTPV